MEVAAPGPALFDLSGRRVLVTGASRGIGRALAVGLARFGAAVLCVARDERALAETVALIERDGVGRGAALSADLRSEAAVRAAVAHAADELGGLDVLVNNAGDERLGPLESLALADWRRVLELSLDACFLLCREAAPLLFARGGKVVNVTSIAGSVALPEAAPYVTAKAGLTGLTRALALDWAPRGVQVNALAPGFVRTEMTSATWRDEQGAAWVVRRTPAGRWGECDDLVGAAAFLASAASDFVTGQVLHVDGGWTIQ